MVNVHSCRRHSVTGHRTLPFGREAASGGVRMTLDRSEGLAETARALAAGEVTSRALVERTLARIEATQGSLNAFRIVRA